MRIEEGIEVSRGEIRLVTGATQSIEFSLVSRDSEIDQNLMIEDTDTSLSEWIVNAIQNFIAEHRNASFEMAAQMADAVEIIGALPLWFDWNGGVAIRTDGELIGFLWDDPKSAKVETDPHLRFLACVTGAKRYPQ